MIKARNVSFQYEEHRVVDDVSFTLEDGEFVGLIGPNGGGKTTLLRLMLGLIEPREGTLTIRGQEPRFARKHLSYVPQYSHMDKDFPISVQEVVAMGLLRRNSFFPWIKKAEKERIYSILERLHIRDIARKPYGQLSGGQQQRVLIARALVSDPSWLLLDEPTSSIDHHVEQDLYELFAELNRSMGIILVTHDLGVVSSYVQRVLCINRHLECHDTEGVDWQHMIEDSYQHSVHPVVHKHEF